MGVKPNSTGDGSRRAEDEGIDRCRPRKESQVPVRGSETGGRWLSGRMTAVGMKPGRERRRRTRRFRPVAARTKSGALPRCCGQAHAHLAKLISRSHAGRRRPREGSRSALFDLPDAHGTEQVCASQSRTACNPCDCSVVRRHAAAGPDAGRPTAFPDISRLKDMRKGRDASAP